jgi:hypothetical protein
MNRRYDYNRRIRTILQQAPASSWTAEEAKIVWEALAQIVAKRQGVL